MRSEHWDVALRAPEVVAANLLGGAAAYDPVPYFWSEQFGRMLQYVGRPPRRRTGWSGAAIRRAHRLGGLLAGRRPAGRGVLTVGLPPDLLQGRRLIEAGRRRRRRPAGRSRRCRVRDAGPQLICRAVMREVGVFDVGRNVGKDPDVAQIDPPADAIVGEWLTLPRGC